MAFVEMKSLLIIGGTGVISYAVANEALKQGIKVTCVNRGKTNSQALDSSIEIIHCDYKNKTLMEEKLKSRFFDAILDVLCYQEKDIDYSISLFKDHCKQFIFISSAEAYNKAKYKNVICDEKAELVNPLWDYSINKVQCEKKLIELAKTNNIYYTIVRPAITYGNTRIPYGFMPSYGYHGTIIQRILHHKPIILFNEGKNIANFLRAEDFAIGLVGLIDNKKAFNESFNISGDECIEWKKIIDILGEIIHVKPIYINFESKIIAHEMPNYSQQILGGRSIDQQLDNNKIKDVVPNFRTNIPLECGIKMTVDYYKNHNYLYGIDYRFDGAWDRIIMKYYKTLFPQLSFIDYLGNACEKDKTTYFNAINSESFIYKVCKFIKKNLNKI